MSTFHRASLLPPPSPDMMSSLLPPQQDTMSNYYQACIVKRNTINASTRSPLSARIPSANKGWMRKERFGKEAELAKLVFPFMDKMSSQQERSTWQLLAQRLVILKTSDFVPISNPDINPEDCLCGLVSQTGTDLLSKEKTERNFKVAMALTVKALIIKGVSRTSIENAQNALSQQQSKDQDLRHSARPPRLRRASSAASLPSLSSPDDGLRRKARGSLPPESGLPLPAPKYSVEPRSFCPDSHIMAGRPGKLSRKPRLNTGLKSFAPNDKKLSISLRILFSSSRPQSRADKPSASHLNWKMNTNYSSVEKKPSANRLNWRSSTNYSSSSSSV